MLVACDFIEIAFLVRFFPGAFTKYKNIYNFRKNTLSVHTWFVDAVMIQLNYTLDNIRNNCRE